MATIDKAVKVSKESEDVAKLVSDLVVAFKAKKPLAQVAAEELPALATAIDGVGQIGAESKEDLEAFLNTWALMGAKVAAALLTQPVVTPPAA